MTRFEALRTARQTHQADHAATVTDPQALVQSADAILAARVGVYQELISQGWTPPPSLVRQLEVDQLLISENDDRHQTG